MVSGVGGGVENAIVALFPFGDGSFLSDVLEFESLGVRDDDGGGEPFVRRGRGRGG